MVKKMNLDQLHAKPGTDYTGSPLPADYIEWLKATATKKRARTVVDYLLAHGFVRQETLESQSGLSYTHGPRAIRDVRELGIPIVTFMKKGEKYATYAFDTPSARVNMLSKAKGRTTLEKKLRKALVKKYGAKDFITLEPADASDLQPDHRIPYEIGGEPDHKDLTRFMLLTASSNRMKSHACEGCPNWDAKDASVCAQCFWAYPENYSHVACVSERLLTFRFTGQDADTVKAAQEKKGTSFNEELRQMILDTAREEGERDAEKPPHGAGA